MKINLSKDREQYISNSTRYSIYGENGKIRGYVAKDIWGVFYIPETDSHTDSSLTADEMIAIAEAMKELV